MAFIPVKNHVWGSSRFHICKSLMIHINIFHPNTQYRYYWMPMIQACFTGEIIIYCQWHNCLCIASTKLYAAQAFVLMFYFDIFIPSRCMYTCKCKNITMSLAEMTKWWCSINQSINRLIHSSNFALSLTINQFCSRLINCHWIKKTHHILFSKQRKTGC